MNLPNKLTLLRIMLVPIFLVFMLSCSIPNRFIFAAAAFGLAAMTDFLDGFIARKNHIVTSFGKLMDPVADKVMVISALIALVELDKIAAWIPIVIISRELLVTSVRMVASGSDGVALPAGIWGKLKTVFQVLAIVFILIQEGFGITWPIGQVLLYAAVVMTVYSGFDYMRAYRKYIKFK